MSIRVSHDAGRWLPGWDGSLYAENTSHHRAFDEWFLADLPLKGNERILDLGCGSGDFTRVLADLVPDGHVLGLDAQPSMLREAERRAGTNQTFVLGPVQDLATLLPDPAAFDVVVCRAVLQWVPAADHGEVYRQVHRLLRTGGRYRGDSGGAGNIVNLLPLLDAVAAGHGGPACPWTFMDAGQALTLLEAAGFALEGGHVRTVAQRRPFTRESLLGWLRSQAFQAYEAAMPGDQHAAFRRGVEDRIDEVRRADGSYDITYVRLDVLTVRTA